jgi:hypothetical protein
VPDINNLNPNSRDEFEQIKALQDKKDTNFVFLFGRVGAGKTALVASLIYFLRTYDNYGNLYFDGNDRGKNLANNIKRDIKSGEFPNRTTAGTVTELECIFKPDSDKPHLKPFKFCFLEMSGEDLVTVSLNVDDLKEVTHNNYQMGRLPDNINVYFKAGVSMTFILIAEKNATKDDDELISSFFDYIHTNHPTFNDSKIILVISKWDSNPSWQEVSHFLETKMQETFKFIKGNAATAFSVGTVLKLENGRLIIKEYNPKPADRIFQKLYGIITGEELQVKKPRALDKIAHWLDI